MAKRYATCAHILEQHLQIWTLTSCILGTSFDGGTTLHKPCSVLLLFDKEHEAIEALPSTIQMDNTDPMDPCAPLSGLCCHGSDLSVARLCNKQDMVISFLGDNP